MYHKAKQLKLPGLMIPLLIVTACIVSSSNRAHTSPLDEVVPGIIRTDATFQHISVLWWIEGDEDVDSSFSLEYRPLAASAWLPGAPAMRAYPTIRVQDAPLGLNYWAASALFPEPGQLYELRLTLTDPDGGSSTRILTARTRPGLTIDPSGRVRYVIPGDGGGDGSQANPFLGLQTAASQAQPGDIFHIAPGVYTGFQLLAPGTSGHPIAFLGPGDGSAVLDGGGTDRGVITLGEYDRTLGHVIIEGLTIQNGRWGIDAQHTHDLAIRHNLVQDVDYGIVNRRGDALESNQTVCDNTIIGRTPWPGQGIPSERGVDLKGTGNVICHNIVRYFGDCLSIQPSTGPSYGNDVFGNDVSYCVDDGIEVDYNQANVRVYRNRVMNARMGVSLQPIRGGPAYVFRNEFFNLESVPVKMHNYTTGFYVVHNTGAKHGNGHGDNGAMWRNAVFRNNLFLGTRYAFEFTTVADEGFRDLDYNAWGTTRDIDPGGPFFKWDNLRYDTLVDLPVGVEDNGTTAAFEDLLNGNLPPSWNVAAQPGTRDLRLNSAAPEIDAGQPLQNFNDPFVRDGAPDQGAFEYGEPLPDYGPRARRPEYGSSDKQPSLLTPKYNDVLTYTITLRNTGAALTSAISLTDTVPTGLAYRPGSLTASLGNPDESKAPTLLWMGTPGSEMVVTITYDVMVTASDPAVLINQADIDLGPWGLLTRSVTIIANGHHSYLSLIL